MAHVQDRNSALTTVFSIAMIVTLCAAPPPSNVRHAESVATPIGAADECADAPHQGQVCNLCGHAYSAMRRMQAGLPPVDGGIAGGGADPFTDVLHYALALEIVPSSSSLIADER